MDKNKTLFLGFILGLVVAFVLQGFLGTVPTEAGAPQHGVSAPGKYQFSTTNRKNDDGIYETIVDTETGAIVRRRFIRKFKYSDSADLRGVRDPIEENE